MANSTIITGQYVQIEQTPAAFGERIFARLIDFVILIAYLYALAATAMLIPAQHSSLRATLFYSLLLPAFFYSLLWEYFNRGQTPGKRLLGIRVVMKDGTTPSMSAYLLRWLLMLVDMYMTSGCGALVILFTRNNQRLGDLAAGTLVIKEKDFKRIQVTLDEFNHLSSGYRPVFPQAENLSLEQINLISETLHRHDADRLRRLRELGDKVRRFLQIDPPVNDETLLQTLIRDYQYYALEEV